MLSCVLHNYAALTRTISMLLNKTHKRGVAVSSRRVALPIQRQPRLRGACGGQRGCCRQPEGRRQRLPCLRSVSACTGNGWRTSLLPHLADMLSRAQWSCSVVVVLSPLDGGHVAYYNIGTLCRAMEPTATSRNTRSTELISIA
jgi:hypothetical protein